MSETFPINLIVINFVHLPWAKLIWEVYHTTQLPSDHITNCSFWWKYCIKLLATYKEHAVCKVGNGSSLAFWTDLWDGVPKLQLWPHLHSFSKNLHISIQSIWNLEDLTSHFHLPLSEEAYGEFQDLTSLLEELELNDNSDLWHFPLGAASYKVATAYRLLSGSYNPLPAIKWIWKTCCQLKHNIFYWLMANDRLNTRALLLRKHFFIQDYTSVMCGLQVLETRDHLFLHCPFAQLCWTYICPTWSPNYLGLQEEIDQLKHLLQVPFSKEIIILATWAIWTTRNDFTFKGITPNLYACRKKFKEELKWIIFGAKRKDYSGFEAWAKAFR